MKVALCAIARLENNYLREWVEHYKSIGIDKIFLGDNNQDGEEHFDEVIKDYIDSGFVEVSDYRRKGTYQNAHYTNTWEKYKTDYDWICFFDIDEFLRLDKWDDIKSCLSDKIYDGYDCVYVCWQNYDDNGLVNVIDGDYNLTKRFTHKIDGDIQIKTILSTKTNKKYTLCAHGVNNMLCNSCNSEGEKTIPKPGKNGKRFGGCKCEKPSLKNMHLDHYRQKTIEEFVMNRMVKGDGCKINGENRHKDWFTIDAFFKNNKKTTEKINFLKKLGYDIS